MFRQTELGAEQRLRCGSTETHDEFWVDHGDLFFEPRVTGADLSGVRPLVDPALPAHLEAEMIHGVRDVHRRTIDPNPFERVIEDAARGPHEGMPGLVLPVAGLFPDEHEPGVSSALAEHGLRRVLPQIAVPTIRSLPAKALYGHASGSTADAGLMWFTASDVSVSFVSLSSSSVCCSSCAASSRPRVSAYVRAVPYAAIS